MPLDQSVNLYLAIQDVTSRMILQRNKDIEKGLTISTLVPYRHAILFSVWESHFENAFLYSNILFTVITPRINIQRVFARPIPDTIIRSKLSIVPRRRRLFSTCPPVYRLSSQFRSCPSLPISTHSHSTPISPLVPHYLRLPHSNLIPARLSLVFFPALQRYLVFDIPEHPFLPMSACFYNLQILISAPGRIFQLHGPISWF